MGKNDNDKADKELDMPNSEKPLSSVVGTNSDNKSLPPTKKNVRAIPNSLLRGTKASTARSNTQKNPKDNKPLKFNSR